MKYDMDIRLTTTRQRSCWVAQKWCVTGADNTKEGLLVHIRFNSQPMAMVYPADLQYASMRGKGGKMKFQIVLVMLLSFILAGCGVNKAMVSQKADGPKDLFVNLQRDPLLISIELRMILESKGYQVALSTEETRQAVVENTKNGSVIRKNVSQSNFRYELVLAYQPIQDRVQLIAASIRDRKENKVLGTYRWSWDRLLPAPTIEGAIEKIDQNLLSKVFVN
jgi:hypothetical protein